MANYGALAQQLGMSTGSGQGSAITTDTANMLNAMAERYDPTNLTPEMNPIKIFPEMSGFLGIGGDTFDPEIEAKLTPKAVKYVQDYYGASEITTPGPDEGVISSMWTRMFGRRPTDDQMNRLLGTLQDIKQREGGLFGSYEKAIHEVVGGHTPSRAELAGKLPDIPGGVMPSAIPEEGYPKATIETPQAAVRVLERDYGIKPSYTTPEFATRAREAGNWVSQLETIQPGISQQIIGPMIVADFNAQYRSNPDDQKITLDDLKIRAQVLPGDNKPVLSFIHPESQKRVPIDPVNFEWGKDIAEWLPEAIVIGADITGAIAGTAAGSLIGPKGMVAGNILLGAGGAYAGRLTSQRIAIDKAGYVFDPTQKGWVNREIEGGRVIRWSDLMKNALPDAYWSAGGAAVGALAFKLGRAILSRGNSTIANAIDEKEFYKALDDFKETPLSQAMKTAGEKPSAAMVMEEQARKLSDEAFQVGPAEAAKLTARVEKLYKQAAILRQVEEAGETAGGKRAVAETIATAELAKLGGTTTKQIADTDAVKFGESVATGIEAAKIGPLNKEIDDLITANDSAINALNVSTRGTETAQVRLGETLIDKVKNIYGDPAGLTGIYGALNKVRNAANRYGRRTFDISEASAFVNKSMPFKGIAVGLPGDIGGGFHALTSKLKGGGKLTFDAIDSVLGTVRNTLNDPKLNQVQRKNLKELGDILERNIIKGLDEIDSQNLLQGNQTTLGKQYTRALRQFKDLDTIYRTELLGNLKEGNVLNLEKVLFRSDMDEESVARIFQNYNFTKNEKELLQGILERKYKTAVLSREGPVGLGSPAKEVPLPGGQKVTEIGGAENAHRIFLDQNRAWINKLYPDDPELSKFGRTVESVVKQAAQAKKLTEAEKKLRKTPWFKNTFDVSDDFQRILREEPQNLLDSVIGAQFPRRALQDVKRYIRALPDEEAKIARGQLKALGMRKLLNPVNTEAVAAGGTVNVRQGVQTSIEHLSSKRGFYNELFDESPVNNMLELLKNMESIIEPRSRARSIIQGELRKPEQKPLVAIPLIFAKVYVGVLNRKARAFNLGRKFIASNLEQKIADSTLDAETLARILRTRKPSKSRLAAETTLSGILGLTQTETHELSALNNVLPEGSQFPEISPYEQAVEAAAVP